MRAIGRNQSQCHASWFPGHRAGYPRGMSELERFINEVEASMADSVNCLSDREAAVFYSGVLEFEQRLDALLDALTLIEAAERN